MSNNKEQTFKPECKDRGFCFDSDCEKSETCVIIEGVRDECMCAICMDKPPEALCLCKRCEIQKAFGDVCEWKKECGFSNNQYRFK